MKRKLRILVALVMSLTMMFGMSTTAFAAVLPEEVNCGVEGHEGISHIYISSTDVHYSDTHYYEDCVYARNFDPGDPIEDNFECPLSWFEGGQPSGLGWYYWDDVNGCMIKCNQEDPIDPVDPVDPATPTSSSSSHEHNFRWQTIYAATPNSDGLEGEVCSCGATRNTQPISAFGLILNDYAPSLIKAAKPGQTVTFEFGEWNSFPKEFMAKLVDKSAQNVTFVFHYNWNHVKQEITIPAGTPIDLNFNWYGPAKMAELYGNN